MLANLHPDGIRAADVVEALDMTPNEAASIWADYMAREGSASRNVVSIPLL
jgi:hypothetical protein